MAKVSNVNGYLDDVRKKALGFTAALAIMGASNASADNPTSPVKDTAKKTEIKANNNVKIDYVNGYDVIKDEKLRSIASELGMYGEMIGGHFGHGIHVGCTDTGIIVYDSRVRKAFGLFNGGNSDEEKYLFSTYDEKNNSSGLKFNVNDNHLRPVNIREADDIRKMENIAPYTRINEFMKIFEIIAMQKAAAGKTVPLEENPFYQNLKNDSPGTYEKALAQFEKMTKTKVFLAQQQEKGRGIGD